MRFQSPAGGSAVVEFASQVPGTFLLVDHAIFRLHHGAAGSIKVEGGKNKEVFDPVTAGAKAMVMSDKDHVPGPAEVSGPQAHDHSAERPESRPGGSAGKIRSKPTANKNRGAEDH